jgi:hypothetical protein
VPNSTNNNAATGKPKSGSGGRMNTYEIWWTDRYGIDDEKSFKNFQALTPGKAKYKAFEYWSNYFEMTFIEFLKGLKCRCTGRMKPSDFFTDKDSFDDMIKYRGVEFAYMGMRVTVDGKPGVITGSNSSANFNVLMDGNDFTYNCHPYWKMDYFDSDGNMIAEHRDKGQPKRVTRPPIK